MMTGRAPARRGLTLLEVLVALVVLALLAAGAQALLATSADVDAWQRQQLAAREQELRLERLFRERLAGALAWRGRSTVGPSLTGDSMHLRLLLIEDPRRRLPPLTALELAVVEEAGWTLLQLREAPVVAEDEPFAGLAAVPAQPFARLPGSWRFAYLRAEADDRRRWQEDWRDQVQLPLAIRLAARDRRALPFLARLRYAAVCAGGREGPPCGPGEVP
jgi:prepilin-type N-terminal cleavage/methylation domain-containing protein